MLEITVRVDKWLQPQFINIKSGQTFIGLVGAFDRVQRINAENIGGTAIRNVLCLTILRGCKRDFSRAIRERGFINDIMQPRKVTAYI